MSKHETVKYYVTNEGLSAALANPEVFATLRGVLLGRGHPGTIKALHTRGFIELDKRGTERIDNDQLILSAAIDRIRTVLLQNNPPTASAPGNGTGTAKGAKAAAPPKPAPRSTPRQPIRYAVQPEPKPSLPPLVLRVWEVMKAAGGGTFAELSRHESLKDVNPGSLRWAIQVLRRSQLVASTTPEETPAPAPSPAEATTV